MKNYFIYLLIVILFYCTPPRNSLLDSPALLNDRIEVSTCFEESMDPAKLNQLITKIRRGQYINIHSLLIAKNNKLIVEEYFKEFDRNTKHPLRSLGKSITSALIGIAIDKGMIKDVNQSILSFFPEYSNLKGFGDKNDIKIKHLLTMTAGLNCGTQDTLNRCITGIFTSPDPVKEYFSLFRAFDPGTRWFYNDGNVIMLENILSRASGLRVDQFEWIYLDSLLLINSGGQDIEWTPRDMLKLGLLYQNGGKWNTDQIISSKWIHESTQIQFETERCSWGEKYGYFWWSASYEVGDFIYDCFYAFGNGGQFIFVFPDIKMVVVFTGGNYNDNILMTQPLRIIENQILPAIIQNL